MLPEFSGDVEMIATGGASRYYLDVTINDFDDTTGLPLEGVVHVDYTNTEETSLSRIVFWLYPNLSGYGGQMSVQQVLIDGHVNQPAPILGGENSVLQIPLTEPLLPGDSVNIKIVYQAIIPADTQIGYNIFSYSDQTLALAGFYPAITVYDQYGWNTEIPPPYGDATYHDIALYEVKLTVPAEMIVAASGSLLDTVSQPDDMKTLTYVSGPMRDFYIVMRDDFEVVSDTVDGVVVNSYYPPGMAKGGKLALGYAVDAVDLFDEIFGPYPYRELDIVATPTRAGGVEYPGIIVAAQSLYENPDYILEHVIGHEVAHQWWYGLVGNNQITEPWLDESLTNYSTLLYWQETSGEKNTEKILQQFFITPYETTKSAGRDRPVAGAVSTFTEDDYGTIVYGKGPLFFHALHEKMGDEIFYEVMQNYYFEYKYKIVHADDLLNTIEQTYGEDIIPIYETWITK
jgi:hypothetical protein